MQLISRSKLRKLVWHLFALCVFVSCRHENARHDVEPEQQISTTAEQSYQVVKIIDGDTFDILKDNIPTRIRIFGIDAPERGMPFYKVSKNYLSELLFKKYAAINTINYDPHGRAVCKVTVDGKDIAAEMVRTGMAWHFKRYSNDESLRLLELEARKSKAGLWRDKRPVAPWEARKIKRQKNTSRRLN